MARLTVLMPVYNAEKFIAEAMDSILRQTFTDFEFLIIDDGSSDNTSQIIQSYQDPRIRFYQNEKNLGISATLNKGIALASTDTIARMDADDISYPERLEKQYSFLEANPSYAMVSTLTRVVTETGDLVRIDKFKSEHFYYNLTFICWIYHSTVMYRKAAVQAVNGYTVPFSEDFELFWQLSRKYKIHNLNEVLLDYRVSGQSLHLVQKKQEYEQAQQSQVLRNIHSYLGDTYTLPYSHLECLRHNFEPLLAENDLSSVVSCIRTLDVITSQILSQKNVNHNPEAIKTAAKYKRDFIVSFYLNHFSGYKKTLFLLQVVTPASILKTIKRYLKQSLKQILPSTGYN